MNETHGNMSIDITGDLEMFKTVELAVALNPDRQEKEIIKKEAPRTVFIDELIEVLTVLGI